jgi:transcriptional regulator GlxA family with amidase domain
VALVLEKVREAPATPYRLNELAAAAGLSVPHFSELFRRQTGHAPIDYVIRQRIQTACQLLDTTDESVAVIAAEVGYSEGVTLRTLLRRKLGRGVREIRGSA